MFHFIGTLKRVSHFFGVVTQLLSLQLLRDALYENNSFPSGVGVVVFLLCWLVEMAADSERESRELLTDALINSQALNSYTMDEFKELFPRKYR